MKRTQPLWQKIIREIALICFWACALWLGLYAWQAWREGAQLGAISQKVQAARAVSDAAPAAPRSDAPDALPDAAPDALPDAAPDAAPDAPAAPAALPAALPDAAPDALLASYRVLAEQNPDMVGWIEIEQTSVDYPVMQRATDPEYYLHRDFEGRYAFAGLPFLDAGCAPGAAHGNQIIYAHNMRTGAMFAALKGYLGEAFRAAHPLIRYDTLAARGEYRVFAVLELDSASRDDPCYQPIDTRDPEALAALRKALVARHAIIIPEAFPAPGAALLTLSTCDQVASPARLVIMAAEAGVEEGNEEARRRGGGGNREAGR